MQKVFFIKHEIMEKTPVQKIQAAKRKKCVRKFLHYFPGGFSGKKYIAWERDYKWEAHVAWEEKLNKKNFRELLDQQQYHEIAKTAVTLESKTNLLFSFEKMALRDAVKEEASAKEFAEGLFEFVYGKKPLKTRFEIYRDMLSRLPVKQTRVLTWPLLTVFGFIADPDQHIFLKPVVTKNAALKFGFDFNYSSKTQWETYESLLEFAEEVKKETATLKPRDMIDIQSFIWVMGSEEYPD
jgi:hypothetical protein